jgi:hypothetical protein
MTLQRDDLSIDQLLADSLVRSVMRADRVDPIELEAMLRSLARRLEARTNGLGAPVDAQRSANNRRFGGSFPLSLCWEAAGARLRPPETLSSTDDRAFAAKPRRDACSSSACR